LNYDSIDYTLWNQSKPGRAMYATNACNSAHAILPTQSAILFILPPPKPNAANNAALIVE